MYVCMYQLIKKLYVLSSLRHYFTSIYYLISSFGEAWKKKGQPGTSEKCNYLTLHKESYNMNLMHFQSLRQKGLQSMFCINTFSSSNCL